MYDPSDSMQALQRPLGEASSRLGQRLFVIANPRAANGEVADRWDEIHATLTEVLGPFDHAMTDAPMAATRLAREALESGYDLVASLGGDGTHNETVNGFFRADGEAVRPGATLAILPCGTGGDFRKSLGLSGDIREAAEHIRDSEPRPCDLGRIRFVGHHGGQSERYFLNIASFGLSGLVDLKVNTSTKVLGGKATFAIGLVRALSEFTPQNVRMRIDDRIDVQVPINMVAVANGRFFGGGMKVAPYARIDDGFFDIVTVRDMDLPDIVRAGIKVYEGRHTELPHISHLQARRLRAEPLDEGDTVLLDVDGEAPGMLPAEFEILPGAILIRG